ncbi:hypothetical protein Ga0100231_023090 [Opitutaceae bacterium TAV4]|nr:hypothetical protein Ga0100231_023090 [Opitutaceae bacterium TAV4]RRK00730.1 hypothetical protein Ga0100230_023340 [Opitutaceae bacterium TAV3]
MTSSSDNASSDSALRLRSHRLYLTGLGGLAGTFVYFLFFAKVAEPLHLLLGLTMITLAALPSLRWARHGEYHFPVFEVFMLGVIPAYAVPLLGAHAGLAGVSTDTISKAAAAIIAFQTAALLAFKGTPVRPRTTPFWTSEIISSRATHWLTAGLCVWIAYIWINLFTDLIPTSLIGVLRAVFYGVGIVAVFALSRLWGLGQLPKHDRFFLVAAILAQLFLNLSSLVMITSMATVILAILGYTSSNRRIPWVPCILALALFGTLHQGKSAMRQRHWDETTGLPRMGLTVGALPAFYQEWFSLSLHARQSKDKEPASLVDRASLFQIVCLIVDQTPYPRPYLYGKTYADIPGQFVPRFFWPGKPVGHISTHTIGIYYGMIDEEGTKRTTIAIGLPAEAYANFGYAGMALIGAFMGCLFRKFTGWGAGSPLFAPGGILLVVLMTWSFQNELTLSIWLTSLFQAVVVVVFAPHLARRFLT